METRGCGLEELIPKIAGTRVKEAWETGNTDIAPMMMGQPVGLVNDIPTCKELVTRFAEEAKAQLSTVQEML